jgi:hypothetical protein
MSTYLYLSMFPESLVASMLPPEQFGTYLATGTRKRAHGEAMFFQLAEGFQSDFFELSDVAQRCVPHPDGQPKRSVYLAIYRVLEHVPVEVLGNLYLATAHGRVLELRPGEPAAESEDGYHLYQELCPVHPLIASTLGAAKFCRFITDPAQCISVPRICFVELDLSGLARDPSRGRAIDLPYHDLEHVRDCLVDLETGQKETKTVDRVSQQAILYRCVKGGFYVGDQDQMRYYPYPTRAELESTYYAWWRCANDTEVQHATVGR